MTLEWKGALMNRRDFTQAAGLATLGLLASTAQSSAQTPTAEAKAPRFAMLVHPGMVMLDLVGPQTVFALTMGQVHLAWKSMTPVGTDIGVNVMPTTTFANCPRDVDVLFVPGGLGGTTALLNDDETLAFLRDVGGRARYVTGVCTGTLLLGAAGLLKGVHATSHWYTRDLLPVFGAIPAGGRVVEDGNVITAGGVTAGIDFGLAISARLRGETWAKITQLVLEYDPQPPFQAGNPTTAGNEITQSILKLRATALEAARTAATRAAARLSR